MLVREFGVPLVSVALVALLDGCSASEPPVLYRPGSSVAMDLLQDLAGLGLL